MNKRLDAVHSQNLRVAEEMVQVGLQLRVLTSGVLGLGFRVGFRV